MSPKPALAQSESKSRFFERLELDEHDEYHRQVYMLMKEEAVAGRKRLIESEHVPVPPRRNSVVPPYSNTQISEIATRREVLRIYIMARPETRAIYDLGGDTDGAEYENWVIRWMLWHVFRYRDSRNNVNRRKILSPSPGQAKAQPNASSNTSRGGHEPIRRPRHRTQKSNATKSYRRTYHWDPVRNQWCVYS